jgi:hypothetical protein
MTAIVFFIVLSIPLGSLFVVCVNWCVVWRGIIDAGDRLTSQSVNSGSSTRSTDSLPDRLA